jgi:hypothetical protein
LHGPFNLINVEAVEAMFIDDWQVGSRRSTNQPLSRAPLGRLGELGRCGPRRNSKSGRLQSKTADGKVIVGGGAATNAGRGSKDEGW